MHKRAATLFFFLIISPISLFALAEGKWYIGAGAEGAYNMLGTETGYRNGIDYKDAWGLGPPSTCSTSAIHGFGSKAASGMCRKAMTIAIRCSQEPIFCYNEGAYSPLFQLSS